MRKPAALTLCALLTACAMGPDYQRPPVSTGDTFRMVEAAKETVSIANLPWWELLRDEELQKLRDKRRQRFPFRKNSNLCTPEL